MELRERVKISHVLLSVALLPNKKPVQRDSSASLTGVPDVWELKGFITHSCAVINSKACIVGVGRRARTDGHKVNTL